MKLGNGGWGYRDMIIYSSIIIIALVFVAVSIGNFYDSLPEPQTYNPSSNINQNDDNEENKNTDVVIDENYYANLEARVKSATLDYVNTYSYDMTDDILNVSVETLVSFNFLDPLYDSNGTICTGYSNVFINNQGTFEIKPYISCSNYVTSGY